jgi:hypothetical protein
MSVVYKSKKDVKEAKKKWNNQMLRQRNPAGYEAHVAAMNAYEGKKDGNYDKNEKMKVKKPKDMADYSTYEGSDTQEELQDLIKDAKNAKPEQMLIDGASREDNKGKSQGKLSIEEANERYISKKYRPDNDLPDRPEKPTIPVLKLPGGITRTRVDNPSGLGGKSYRYEADGKSLYKDKGWNPKNNNYGDKSFRQDAKKGYGNRAPIVDKQKPTNSLKDLKTAVKQTKKPHKHFKDGIQKPTPPSKLGPSGKKFKPVKPKDSAFKGSIPKAEAPGKGVLAPGNKPTKKLSKAFKR